MVYRTAPFSMTLKDPKPKFALLHRQALEHQHTILHIFSRPCTKYLSEAAVQYNSDLNCLLLIGHASRPYNSTGRHFDFQQLHSHFFRSNASNFSKHCILHITLHSNLFI